MIRAVPTIAEVAASGAKAWAVPEVPHSMAAAMTSNCPDRGGAVELPGVSPGGGGGDGVDESVCGSVCEGVT